MRFWDAVASAGPHANNLHLAPDRQPHQYLSHQSMFTGRMLFLLFPTNGVKALKADSQLQRMSRVSQSYSEGGSSNAVNWQNISSR